MNRDEDTILAEAADWHAVSDGDAMDWDGFTAWLEADPRHRLAYDEIALADALLMEHGDGLRPAFADTPEAVSAPVLRPRFAAWQGWVGGAIAASLVAVLAVPTFLSPAAATYETDGTSRTIALDDGSSIVLAPHSKLTVEGRRQERLALSGGAWFDIVHDPDRPMTITAGQARISDIGTRFDVQSNDASVRVEVAEGKVAVGADALSQPIHLVAGKALDFDGEAGAAVITQVAESDTGEWRQGRLSYSSAPLSLVATDLSRYAGVSVKVPASMETRRFSGTLIIGDGNAALRDLSQVMALSLVRDGDGYRLVEPGRVEPGR